MRPFTSHASPEDLDDLRHRLTHTRIPEELDDTDPSIGPGTRYIDDLVDYWLHNYDWRHHEASINKLPQYVAEIGDSIHFAHILSTNPHARPLLLVHGWPDSFYRFHRLIPLLRSDFHLIVPSIPGFGFSTRKARSHNTTADIFVTLMSKELGYTRFFAHGGDIGGYIVRAMASRHPDVVAAMHLTDVGYPIGGENLLSMSADERAFISDTAAWVAGEGAYLKLHATKPGAIAYPLLDSPAGLAAWFVSMIASQAGDRTPDAAFGGRDSLLTNLMIYWLTRTAGSAADTYRHLFTSLRSDAATRSAVPAGVSLFPRELQPPREWAERTLNLVAYEKMVRGGHFAALEEPQLLATAIRTFFGGQPGL